jgi:hypothetical protein
VDANLATELACADAEAEVRRLRAAVAERAAAGGGAAGAPGSEGGGAGDV